MNKFIRLLYKDEILILIFILINYINVILLINNYYYPEVFFIINGIILLCFSIEAVMITCFGTKKMLNFLGAGVIILFVVGNILFPDYWRLEGGPDQGVYTGFAAEITYYKSITFNNDYLLNFPGFHFSNNLEAIGQFSPLYSVFLSNFYAELGIYGFIVANILLIFSGIYLISKILIFITERRESTTLFAIAFLTSYVTIYFSRSGYVENFLFVLIWSGIYLFVKGMYTNKLGSVFLSLVPFLGIILVRFEFFLYILGWILAFLTLSYFRNKEIWTTKRSELLSILASLLIGGVVVYIGYFYYNHIDSGTIQNTINQITGVVKRGGDSIGGIAGSYYNVRILTLIYSVLSLISVCLFLYFLLFSKHLRKYAFVFLILGLLILPQILFIYSPGIAFTMPWFFRRFWSGLFIVGLISFVIYIVKTEKGYLKGVLTIGLLTLNIIFSGLIYGYSFKEENNFYEFFRDIAKLEYPIIFYDKYGIENYGNITSHYFEKKDIILDRDPIKEKVYYDYYLSTSDYFYIITPYNLENLKKAFLEQHSINIGENIVDQKQLEFNTMEIAGFCDIRKYVISPKLFESYGKTFGKCLFGYEGYKERNMELILYKVKNTFYKTKGLDKLRKEDRVDSINIDVDNNLRF